jgi:hypothetical protein
VAAPQNLEARNVIDDPLNRTKARRGEDLPWSKLTEADVLLIRKIVEERERTKQQLKYVTNAALARKFGVSLRAMDRVVTGETWGHVE